MKTYIKKPKTIQVIPFTRENIKKIEEYFPRLLIEISRHPEGKMIGKIKTFEDKESRIVIEEGDYINVEKGEWGQVIKKHIFEEEYTPLEDLKTTAKLTQAELGALIYVVSKQANFHHEEAMTHGFRREVAEMEAELNLARMYQRIIRKAHDWLEEEVG